MLTRLRRPPTLLLAITGLVLLAHWGVLFGIPQSLGFLTQSRREPDSAAPVFTTRMIRAPKPEAAAAAPAEPVPARKSRALQPATTETQTAAEPMTPGAAPAEMPTEPQAPDVSEQIGALETQSLPALTAPPSPTTNTSESTVMPVFAFPPSVSLLYDVRGEVKGFPYFVSGQLDWKHDGTQYDARLQISHFLLGARVQTSKGSLGAEGLAPLRFGDKVRSEVAAHFERDKGKVTFSANTPDVPLQPGAQDQLSVFLQLASMLAGDAARFPQGTSIRFQTIGPRSAQQWVFQIGALESLDLPGGIQQALHVTREPVNPHEPLAEAWLAPAMWYLPVRIRLSQSNGDFVEQKWESTKFLP